MCSGDSPIRALGSDGNRVIIRFYCMEGVLLEGIGMIMQTLSESFLGCEDLGMLDYSPGER